MSTQETILITGGAGFLGHHIVTALHSAHPTWPLTVLDVLPASAYDPPFSSSFITYIQADITNAATLTNAFQTTRPTIVVHTAGFVPKGNTRYTTLLREQCRAVNVEGTRNMLSAAKSVGVKAFVYTSSITTITDDLSQDHPNMNETRPPSSFANPAGTLIYGSSKAEAEALVLSANDPGKDFLTTALRPSVLLGPGDENLLPHIHACIAARETPFQIGPGTNLYDFTYAPNVADAHVLAIENLLTVSPVSGIGETDEKPSDVGAEEKGDEGQIESAAGQTFFITNASPIPFRAFMLAVWAQFGHYPPYTVQVPQPLAWMAGLSAEWTRWAREALSWARGDKGAIDRIAWEEGATLSRGSVKDCCQCAYADGGKARRVLGYVPRVGLEEALRISCEDLKERLARRGLGEDRKKEV
ncbi:NAD(P)-binding protein [Aulographum hederae CBS 113979]|uniref:NAD(P)-binding protein n=1 Tax=Aulographum hederae CBS 113979 TaxID=1176131 RepID=A0A6G1GNQ7_9PEZI|nr:NAD(P)-binding protein [Aulographum hederae CBS 113979]